MSYFNNNDLAFAEREGLPVDEALVSTLEELQSDVELLHRRGSINEDRFRAIHGYLNLAIAEVIRVPRRAEGE